MDIDIKGRTSFKDGLFSSKITVHSNAVTIRIEDELNTVARIDIFLTIEQLCDMAQAANFKWMKENWGPKSGAPPTEQP